MLTLGSKPTNSRPRQSRTRIGANCPVLSIEYGRGGVSSHFAELSRLHNPHLHTKCAVLFFPTETSFSSYIIVNNELISSKLDRRRTCRFIVTNFGCTSLQELHLTLQDIMQLRTICHTSMSGCQPGMSTQSHLQLERDL